MANGCRVTVVSRKMIVRPANRMLSAISFGVFCRLAPSTRAIMRSRNVSPGRAVMRTTIWSDSTLVPPVTAERSPPESRMTGADSPVMADSSTEAMPAMISPSDGIISPALTTTMSSTSTCDEGTGSSDPSDSRRLAMVSDRALRRVSACALPLPSATASAKLANSTVNHRNRATSPAKRFSLPEASPMSRKNRIVVTMLPTPTTSMTGLRTINRGCSLRRLSTAAVFMIVGSNNDRVALARPTRPEATRWPGGCWAGSRVALIIDSSETQVLGGGAARQNGEVGQADDDQHDAHEQADEQRRSGGEGAGRRGDCLLAGQRAGESQRRNDEDEPADEHRQAERRVVPVRVTGQPTEGRAVVVARRREGVGHLRQAVRAGVEDRCLRRVHHDRNAGEDEHHDRHRQDVDRDQLHLRRLDLLAQILGRSADHQPGDEHRQDGEDQHAVEARTDTAGADLAEHDVHQRHGTAAGGEAVVGRDHGTGRRAGGRREQARRRRAEADLLALEVAAAGQLGDGVLIGAKGVELGVAVGLESLGGEGRGEPEHEHGAEQGPALLAVLGQLPEGVGQRERDQQDQKHLEQVREPVGAAERVAGVGVEEAAAVGAELLDDLLAGRGAAGNELRRTVEGVGHREAIEVLDHALADEDEGTDNRDRQQDADDRAGQVDPEVADR